MAVVVAFRLAVSTATNGTANLSKEHRLAPSPKNTDLIARGLATATAAVVTGTVIAVPFVGLLPVVTVCGAIVATAVVAKAVEKHRKKKG